MAEWDISKESRGRLGKGGGREEYLVFKGNITILSFEVSNMEQKWYSWTVLYIIYLLVRKEVMKIGYRQK